MRHLCHVVADEELPLGVICFIFGDSNSIKSSRQFAGSARLNWCGPVRLKPSHGITGGSSQHFIRRSDQR